MRPMIGPETAVMSLQNGIDAAERLDAVVGMEHVIGEVTYISAALEAPGVIRQVSQFRRIELESMIRVITRQGQQRGVPTPAAGLVHAALLPAELKARRAAV